MSMLAFVVAGVTPSPPPGVLLRAVRASVRRSGLRRTQNEDPRSHELLEGVLPPSHSVEESHLEEKKKNYTTSGFGTMTHEDGPLACILVKSIHIAVWGGGGSSWLW